MTRKTAIWQLGMTILFFLAVTSVADAGGAVRELQLPFLPSGDQDQCRVIAFERLKRTLLTELTTDILVQKEVAAARQSMTRFIALAAGAAQVEIVDETCRDGACRFKGTISNDTKEIIRIVNELSRDERYVSALESAGTRAQHAIRELDDLKGSMAGPKVDHNSVARLQTSIQKLAAAHRLEEGIMVLMRGNPRQAVESFSRSLQADPKLVHAYIQRGYIYGMLGRYEEAVADFSRAQELAPAEPAVYMGRGVAHASLGRFDKAILDYGGLLAKSPRSHEAYYQRGLAFAAAGDYRRAIGDYDRAASLKPTHAMTYLKRAEAQDAAGDSRKAVLDYTRAIELNLKFSSVYTKRGIAFTRLREYKKAIADFDSAIGMNPDDRKVYGLRSQAYTALGVREPDQPAGMAAAVDVDTARSRAEAPPREMVVKKEQANRAIHAAGLSPDGHQERASTEGGNPDVLHRERGASPGPKDSVSAAGREPECLPARVDQIPAEEKANENFKSRREDYLTASGESPPDGEADVIPRSISTRKKAVLTVQVLSATDRESTIRLAGELERSGFSDVLIIRSESWYALCTGRYTSAKEAGADLRELRGVYRDAFLRSRPEPSIKVVYDGSRKEGRSEAEVARDTQGTTPLSPVGEEAVHDEKNIPAGRSESLAAAIPAGTERSSALSVDVSYKGMQTIAATMEGIGPEKHYLLYARSETGSYSDVAQQAEERAPETTKVNAEPSTEPVASAEREAPPPQTLPPVTFSGVLQDPYGKPLPGATIVKVDDALIRTASGPGGRFSLPGLPADSDFLLVVELAGYLPLYISSFQYPPDTAVVPAFTLQPVGGTVVAEKPKQPVVIEADNLRYDRDTDTYEADGHVVISYTGEPGGTLTADQARLNQTTNQAEAVGHVVVKSGRDTIYGDRIVMDIDTKEGSIYGGNMFIAESHFYVKGDRIDKRGDATYHVENASATTCDGDKPDWRILGRELDVTIDGYGTIKHGRFLAKDVPVVYAPYFVFPAKTTRQSGFLFPYMSYSRDKLGVDVEVPFYWAISKNMDATFYQRYMTQRGFKEGMEFRYTFSPDHYGTFYADFLNDRKRLLETNGAISRDWQPGEKRWSIYLNHISNFSPGFYLRSDIAKVSDNWYFKDFSSHNYYLSNYSTNPAEKFRKISFVADESINSLDSTVRVVKDWQSFNLTGLVRYTDDFTKQSNDTTMQKFPEITLTGVKQPILGSPVHYELTSLYGYYYRVQGQKGNLFDIKPTLTLPFNIGTALQVTPGIGWQGSFWDRDDSQVDTGNRHGNRQLFNMGGTMTTEVQRIFNVGGETVDKIRHSIKPEVTYTYIPNVDQTDIPDYVTQVPGQNTVTYALTNTLTGRLKDKAGSATYQEYVRLKMFQTFDIKEARRDVGALDANQRPFSDLNLELDLNPFPYLSLAARNKMNVYSGAWTQTNYDLSLSDWCGDTATVGYRYTQNLLRETNLSLKGVITKNWELTYFMRRNEDIQKNMENTFGINYRQQCWSVKMLYSDKISYDAAGVEQPDRMFAILVSFYGLGAIGN
jgi:LPS-assembly protein